MLRSRRLTRRHFLEFGLQGGVAFLAAAPLRKRSRKCATQGTVDPRLQRILAKYGGEFGGPGDTPGENDHVCL